MRRDLFDSVFRHNQEAGYVPGDEFAHRAAAALADRFDAPTIIGLTNVFTFLKEMGGQAYVITLRERVDATGALVPADEPGASWRTMAMRCSYETQDARVDAAKPPKDVLGVAVTDFNAAPHHVELDVEEAPEAETDLRDEIEADADALAQPLEPVALTD